METPRRTSERITKTGSSCVELNTSVKQQVCEANALSRAWTLPPMIWMLQAVFGKKRRMNTSTQRSHVSPPLTFETHTHPCDRSMDVGTCLLDNSVEQLSNLAPECQAEGCAAQRAPLPDTHRTTVVELGFLAVTVSFLHGNGPISHTL